MIRCIKIFSFFLESKVNCIGSIFLQHETWAEPPLPQPSLSPPPCDVSPRYQLSPSFRGFKPDECKPEMNRQYYEKFGEPNELDLGFTEPCSVLLTPRKRKRLWSYILIHRSHIKHVVTSYHTFTSTGNKCLDASFYLSPLHYRQQPQ